MYVNLSCTECTNCELGVFARNMHVYLSYLDKNDDLAVIRWVTYKYESYIGKRLAFTTLSTSGA